MQGCAISPRRRPFGALLAGCALYSLCIVTSAARPFVVYERLDRGTEVYSLDVQRKRSENLTNHRAHDWEPDWSPDGRRIVFLSDRVWNPELFVMDRDGRGVRRVTDHENQEHEPSWSPDGSEIAVALQSAADQTSAIAAIDVDTGEVRPITTGPWDRWPHWSPGGTKLVYTRVVGREARLVVVDRDGAREQMLVRRAYSGRWSPDGQQIAYVAMDGGLGIYDIHTGVTRHIDPRLPDVIDEVLGRDIENRPYDPTWTADGQSLVFRDVERDLYRVDIADGDVHQLPAVDVEYPKWYDSAFVRGVAPAGKRPFSWGWLKGLGTAPP
jgi:Tol biopolymer transport system component